MSKYKNNNQSGQRQQFQPEDLSLKGYYAIAALSVTIGIVTVGLLNLATPLEIISDRMAFVSQFSGPLFLLFIPPLIYLLLVYILSLLVVRIILGPISRYQNIVTLGGSISEDLEEKAGRRLLNVPFIFIPAVLVLWIVISAIPWLGGYLSGQVDLRTAVIIFARTSMVGLISAFVASHLMENYSRKKLIPYFFPQGRLVDVGGTFRISISRRIQLLNPLGTLVPGIVLLVTLVTLQWEVDTSQISSAEYGWIIIRFSLILIGIFFMIPRAIFLRNWPGRVWRWALTVNGTMQQIAKKDSRRDRSLFWEPTASGRPKTRRENC